MREETLSKLVYIKLVGMGSWKSLQSTNETTNKRTTLDKMETTPAYNKDSHVLTEFPISPAHSSPTEVCH